jgi:hypothetical protein
MPLNMLWIALFAAALLAGGPALADDDDDDDWEERHHYGHKKKGKHRKNGKNEPRYYLYYYVPRETGAPVMLDCPPPPPPAVARRPDTPSVPQAAPRAFGTGPGAFPKESPQERSLAGERQREILEKELATEQELLALAKRDLAEQQATIANDDGNRSTARLRPYMDNVELHENNVAALRRELSRLRHPRS